jgi:pimeloyl-ACP methyl ester carboxylesterase
MKKTIVLVHGWNYLFYNAFNRFDPWEMRSDFLQLLEREYTVIVCRLPGFSGQPEPNVDVWSVSDYAEWFGRWLGEQNGGVDCIVGYSFGCAVILDYIQQGSDHTPLILISPAIVRADSGKSRLAHMLRFLPRTIRDALRNNYLYIINPYYRYGTRFLRNSYNAIVRRNMTNTLLFVGGKNTVYLIYGEQDTATPFSLVEKSIIGSGVKTHTIPKSGHNIAKTHHNTLFTIIKNIINEIHNKNDSRDTTK